MYWLFSYTALTDRYYNRDGVCLLRGTSWSIWLTSIVYILVAQILASVPRLVRQPLFTDMRRY
jgi:hypothetical protein